MRMLSGAGARPGFARVSGTAASSGSFASGERPRAPPIAAVCFRKVRRLDIGWLRRDTIKMREQDEVVISVLDLHDAGIGKARIQNLRPNLFCSWPARRSAGRVDPATRVTTQAS